ncbi:MAG TPA: hypothetical protein PLK76_01905 [bacterium]|nr:hypothetical protein [bacterium]
MKLRRNVIHKIAMLLVLAMSPMFINSDCNKKKDDANLPPPKPAKTSPTPQEIEWGVIDEYLDDVGCTDAKKHLIPFYYDTHGDRLQAQCTKSQRVLVSKDGCEVFIIDKNDKDHIWYHYYNRSSSKKSRARIAAEVTTNKLKKYTIQKFIESLPRYYEKRLNEDMDKYEQKESDESDLYSSSPEQGDDMDEDE